MPKKILTQTQCQYIAYGEAVGWPAAKIANATALSKIVVQKVLDGGILEERQRLEYDVYRTQQLQRMHASEVRHSTEMQAMVPDAYATLQQGVVGYEKNPNLAIETAKWVLQNAGVQIVSEKSITQGNTVNTQVNLTVGPKVEAAIDTTMDAISRAVEELTPLQPVGSQSRHRYTTSEDQAIIKREEPDGPQEVTAEPITEGLPVGLADADLPPN